MKKSRAKVVNLTEYKKNKQKEDNTINEIDRKELLELLRKVFVGQ